MYIQLYCFLTASIPYTETREPSRRSPHDSCRPNSDQPGGFTITVT